MTDVLALNRKKIKAHRQMGILAGLAQPVKSGLSDPGSFQGTQAFLRRNQAACLTKAHLNKNQPAIPFKNAVNFPMRASEIPLKNSGPLVLKPLQGELFALSADFRFSRHSHPEGF